jgi:hypothetical protein
LRAIRITPRGSDGGSSRAFGERQTSLGKACCSSGRCHLREEASKPCLKVAPSGPEVPSRWCLVSKAKRTFNWTAQRSENDSCRTPDDPPECGPCRPERPPPKAVEGPLSMTLGSSVRVTVGRRTWWRQAPTGQDRLARLLTCTIGYRRRFDPGSSPSANCSLQISPHAREHFCANLAGPFGDLTVPAEAPVTDFVLQKDVFPETLYLNGSSTDSIFVLQQAALGQFSFRDWSRLLVGNPASGPTDESIRSRYPDRRSKIVSSRTGTNARFVSAARRAFSSRTSTKDTLRERTS